MNVHTVAEQFVELCNQGKNFDVMQTMYAPDIVSVEPNGEETSGKTPVIQKTERFQSQNPISGETVRGPFFNGPNQFAVHFTFEVTPKATGQRITVEEVGIYTVKDNKITREQFFAGGAR